MAGLLLLPAAALVAPFHSARAWAGRGNFIEDWVARAELSLRAKITSGQEA